MKIRCLDDIDNNLIKKNREIFDKLHELNSSNYLKYDFDNIIYVPTIINICIRNPKNSRNPNESIDYLKYCDYMIQVLNDGFSGNIKSKYKNYSEKYFINILGEPNGKIVYQYINYRYDTKIRFYLKSIIYHDKNFEYDFCKNKTDTDEMIKDYYLEGFKIKDEHKHDLHINIMKFTCDTLGVSTFPWIKHVTNKDEYPMLVFIDYKTINPEISTNKFNECRTLIHEVGHIFGLKHIFGNKKESIEGYKIILGKKYFEKIFGIIDEINEKTDNIRLYPDTPIQKYPTIKNPIEKNNFNIEKGIPVNFACFMDYSPDAVLTHFTKSQALVMRNIINIYKPKLISKTFKNKRTTLFLPLGKKININKDYFCLKQTKKDVYYVYKIDYKELKYKISDEYDLIDKIDKNIENTTLCSVNKYNSII